MSQFSATSLDEIVNHMTDTNKKQLGDTLWSISDQLRGAMDAEGFRDTRLPINFLNL
jgi:type I restriction-modification system DNA methylase subunit